MRYTAPTELSAAPAQTTDDDTPTWVIEELAASRGQSPGPGSKRWVGLAIGVMVAIVGFGFVSHVADPPPAGRNGATPVATAVATAGSTAVAAASGTAAGNDRAVVVPAVRPVLSASVLLSAPLVVTTPLSGTTVDGGLVEVRGVADRSLGSVHVSIVLGDAVLGWTDVRIDGARPFRIVVPVFAPPIDAPVTLRIEGPDAGVAPGRAVSVDLRLRAGRAVGLWRAGFTPSAPDKLAISGFAPLADARVMLSVRTATGRVLADRVAVIGVDETRPGSVGGRLIGLGSFRSQIDLADLRWDRADGLLLVASLRDPVLGTTESIERTIVSRANRAAPGGVDDDEGPAEG